MKRRTKIATLATTLLVGVTTLSIGFASWVISNNAETESTGNVKAESVEYANVELKVSPESGTSVVYGPNVAAADSEGWLTTDDATATESLTVTFTLTFKTVDKIDIGLVVADADSGIEDAWATAVELGFVKEDVTYAITGGTAQTYYEVNDATIQLKSEAAGYDASTEYTLTVTATFAWGEHFNSSNPYTYYNAKGRNDICEGGYQYDAEFDDEPSDDVTYADDAYASLSYLNELLGEGSGLTYTFTFTGYSAGYSAD